MTDAEIDRPHEIGENLLTAAANINYLLSIATSRDHRIAGINLSQEFISEVTHDAAQLTKYGLAFVGKSDAQGDQP